MNLSLESLATLLESRNHGELYTNLVSLTQELGFDQFLVSALTMTPDGRPTDKIISSYSPDWLKRYQEQDYFSVDPIVSHALRSNIPLIWDPQLYDTESRQQFREEAMRFGIQNGVSIPVRAHLSTGVFNLVSHMKGKRSLKHIKSTVADAHLFFVYAYEAMLKPVISNEALASKQLISPRERECLKWSSAGKTAWETSKILNISERTVNFHLGNSAAKLGTRGTRHTVTRAILLGLI